jgi:hypothetical protein
MVFPCNYILNFKNELIKNIIGHTRPVNKYLYII